QAQPNLYNGHEIIKDNYIRAIVHNSEDTLEIADITRKKMNDKMNDRECVTRKVKIAPHDYSKENLLATFTPQKQLTPEQIFWSNDLMKIKSEALRERTKVSRPIKTFTVYPPNTPAALVPKVLPTKIQVKILIFTLIQLFSEFVQTCKKRITPSTITDGEMGFEQTKACYLQEVIPFFKTLKDNFEGIQKAVTKEVKEMKVFCVETNSELNAARFTNMYVANTTAETRCLALEAELDNLRETNNWDNQTELINHFSKLEELSQLHLKESVETIRDIIEEAKVVRPLDRSIVSACRYTKHSQELLEYTIGTCPQGSQPRAKQLAYTPLIRKKQVTISQPSNKLDSTTHPHVVTVTSQSTNVPVPPSTGVDCYTIACGSPPMSHVKLNRISLAKDKMGDVNAPSDQTPTMAPPVRADDQILPHIRWIPIGKSNCYLDLEKSQSNPIYKIAVDLLKNTNFFRAFTASSNLPSIYIQQEKEGHSDCDSKHLVHQADHPPSLEEAQATGTTDKPSKAKRIKRSASRKTHQPRSSPKSVGESEAEEVHAEELQVADEDADFQKAVEESMKHAYALPKGPLPLVVIREPKSGKYQPLLEVPGKGKAKVSEEQVAHDLLSLQMHKKTSPADHYIFQRRVSKPTASSFHDESPYEVLGQSDSEEESKKIGLGIEKGSQDEGQAGRDPNAQAEGELGSNTGAQAEGQAGSNPNETFEGQAGSNPDETSEGQAGSDPGNAEARVQSTSSHVVHVGSDREHMDLDLADEEPVLLEEPASSSGTLSSLQHLSIDFSFGDQFFSDKPSDADKSAKTEVESMVNVSIQQALSSISLMTSPIIDLTSRPESPKEHQQLKATTTDTTTTTTTLLPPQAPQQSMTEACIHSNNWTSLNRDLPKADMKEILHQRMWETDSYKSHKDHMQLFKALEKSINRDQSKELAHDLAEARKKRKKGRESPKTPPGSPSHHPPPPPPPAGPSGKSGAPRASRSQVKPPPPPPPPPTSTNQDNLDMDEAMGPDEQVQLSDEEDIGSAHIPTVNLRQGWWKPFEEERPTTPKPAWSIRSSNVPFPTNNWASTLASNYSPPPEDSLLVQTAYEIVKVFHPDVVHFQYQMEECHKLLTDSVDDPVLRHNVSKPLPLGGPPGQVTIQFDFFFNKDLEYLRYDSKGHQFWSEEECKYDIAAMYGISHWWFQRQRFYIDRHTFEGDRSTVKTHMQILSVVRIEFFSMYGYDYMKKIVLCRADLNEHVIAERDFKYLYPSDFKDLNLLNLQGLLNHLPPKDKKILTTAVNQWTRQLVIR
nr:hypothetical protein [Tanacetum cinerariifolium]